jgi:hypothetical protein
MLRPLCTGLLLPQRHLEWQLRADRRRLQDRHRAPGVLGVLDRTAPPERNSLRPLRSRLS